MHRWVPPPTNKTILLDLLEAGSYYQCDVVIQYSLHNIDQARFRYHPAELISCCLRFENNTATRAMFCGAFKRLAGYNLREISPVHERLIGPVVFSALARVLHAVDEHRQIVAAEPPAIDIHTPNCVDHKLCEQDWRGIWWNGMGRFLLDGRNPLPWDAAMSRFQTLQFGRMGEGCKDHVMSMVRDGTAFVHAETLVFDVGNHLARMLIKAEASGV